MNDTTSPDPSGVERIREEAAQHFIATVNRRPSRAEQRALDAWLAADPRHAEAFAAVKLLWEGAGALPEAKERAAQAPKTLSRRDLGKAALLMAAGGAAAWVLSDHPFADHRTGAGERQSFTAPDGSLIELAPRTRLSLAFNATERSVVLHEGELFVRVAAEARPFTVRAGEGTTTALGTAFAVAYREGETRVTVTEHATRVSLAGASSLVSAGSQLHYATVIGPVEPFDADVELGWRDGRLVFVDEPLGDVVKALNIWRQGRIVVMDADLARRPITLVVNVERSPSIVSQLERALPVRVVQFTPLLILLMAQK
ncbi:MAG: FecR domain-containing protein [Pseudolabrys sp.]|nr:FecR domain-containing protein [Pseudolabrys sp.]